MIATRDSSFDLEEADRLSRGVKVERTGVRLARCTMETSAAAHTASAKPSPNLLRFLVWLTLHRLFLDREREP